MAYRVGFPGWRFLARHGVPTVMRIDVHFDQESQSFWANSPHLDGLVVSGATLDELREEVRTAADTLLELDFRGQAHTVPEYRFRDEALCAA